MVTIVEAASSRPDSDDFLASSAPVGGDGHPALKQRFLKYWPPSTGLHFSPSTLSPYCSLAEVSSKGLYSTIALAFSFAISQPQKSAHCWRLTGPFPSYTIGCLPIALSRTVCCAPGAWAELATVLFVLRFVAYRALELPWPQIWSS